MAWGRRLVVVAVVLMAGTVAMAEPAGDPRYVPVGLVTSDSSPDSVVVEPGDHLWWISQTHLDVTLGKKTVPREVAAYWLLVIEANRDRLRSGDPDLIFPGEVVLLPPVRAG